MKKAGCFLITIAITFLYSCGGASLFSTSDDASYKITINSYQNGSIVQAGENVVFRINTLDYNASENKPTSLTIILINIENGQKIAESTLEPVQVEKDIPINFKDIKTGEYRLTLTLYNQAAILAEKELTVFYTEGEYLINSIKSSPLLINPGSKVLLSADLIIPKQANPWLKWSSNGVLLNKGFLKEGLYELHWQAPREAGVYTVTLEVFPVRPVESENLTFGSPLFMNIELYVTTAEKISERDLYPVESYFALFHLNDNLKDSVQEWEKLNLDKAVSGAEETIPGTGMAHQPLPGGAKAAAGEARADALAASTAAEIVANGELKPVSFGKEMGYQFNGSAGINIPYLIIPVSKGNIQPFTLSLGLSFDELLPGTNLITMISADERFYFRLFLNAALKPEVMLKNKELALSLVSGIKAIKIGQPYFLALSIFPEKNGFYVNWFLDGFPAGSQFIDQPLNSVAEKGKTIVGGEKGFKGVLDELGVYYQTIHKQPSTDPYLYRDARLREYSSSLVFANGFDSFILPPELKTEGEANADGVNLQLAPRAALTLPALAWQDNPLRVYIDFAGETAFTCSWQEKGFCIITETLPDKGKNEETINTVRTKVLMLELEPSRIIKVKIPDDRALLNNQASSNSDDNFARQSWETVLSLSRPAFNNPQTAKKELPVHITNSQSSPLYIDSILVYTE